MKQINLPLICLMLILSIHSSICSAQLSISSTTPNSTTYTTCNTNSYVGCSSTYNGSLIWRAATISGATITFNIAKYTGSCSGATSLLAAGTAFIKDSNPCGAILASQTYSANPGIINITYTFPNPGTYQLVAVCTTATSKFYSEPISVTVVAPTPAAPILSLPSNSSCVNYGGPITFTWSNVGATSYRFLLYDAVTTAQVIVPQTTIGNSYILNTTSSLWGPNKKYYWTVQACNGYNNCSNPPTYEFYTSPTIHQATTNSPVSVGSTAHLYSNNTNLGVIYNWNGPTTLGSVTNPTISNAQATSTGTYTVTVSNSWGCSYTSTASLTVGSSSPGLQVLSPNGGQTFNGGSNATIQWNAPSVSGNVQIELVNTSNIPMSGPNSLYPTISSIAPSGGIAASTQTFSWPISTTIPSGQYKIKLYSLTTSSYVDYSDNYFTINNSTVIPNCISWSPSPPTIGNGSSYNIDQEAYNAMQYLCVKNVIQNPQYTNQIDNNLRRDELAKITFKALFSPNGATNPYVNGTTAYSDDFPVPYFDLQPPYTTYTKEAKAMCYLEYGNCVSPFDKDFTHFRPADSIVKRYALKELLEAFNIPPAASGTSFPWPVGNYTDVNTSIDGYEYIIKAYNLGIIGDAPTFGVATALSRRNAFRYLYKLLQLYDANSLLVGGSKPIPQISDYYIPFNQKVGNMNNLLGIDEGAFNSYTKTSFGIAGKMPLVFAHGYNSANTNYPNAFNVLQPMGKGWNHNYNCYIKRFDDGNGNDIRFTVFWGDGTLISFDSTGTNVFIPLEKGVYSSLQLINGGNTFKFTTKTKVVYTFNRQTNLQNTFWCLNHISDRNNNNLNIVWQVVNSKLAQVNQVSDTVGRKLNFIYTNNKLTQLQCVTGSIVRNVMFTYNSITGDLQTYSDPMGQTSTYIYYSNPSPCEEHLLKQIQLPKGNIIDNTYDKRRLVSSQFAGQYLTTIKGKINYVAGNNIDYSSDTISTTQQGQTIKTIVNHNELGGTVHVEDPTSNIDIGYNTIGQPTKPTTFTNTTNGITATTSYDAMGNVLNVTKSAPSSPSISESFTYNSFNDVLTYTNGNGNTTTFTYNGTGNLTKITDALGNNTVIIPNIDGTVQKVTNPSGIYSEYAYDNYGNTKQTTLMNTITSLADYDDASRLTQATNPNNVKTKYSYNPNDQVTSVVYDFGNLNNTMSYTYDLNGNLTTITNPKGDNTILTYNNQDQLIQYNFLGLIKKYAYNQNGTLDTFINQNGIVFKNNYNVDGTLANDGYANYTYNPTTKNLSTITSIANNSIITFGYDNYQRVNNINYNYGSGNNNVAYEYDNTNNITKITYPGLSGLAIGYTYDALGRLHQVKNFNSGTIYATYSYHNDGRLQQCDNGNGTKTLYLYDALGRLDSISNQTSTGTIICAYHFTLDNLGNHTSELANEPYSPSMPIIPSSTVVYTHTATNRMTNQGSTATTFNNNGNEVTNTGSFNSTYTWDNKENLLTSTNPSLNCEYDGAENRRRRNNTRFVLDLLGDNLLMETDLNGNPNAYYIQGLGLICRLDASQSNPAYYHYDYRGSTTAITNASQNVTHKYLYGAFGEQLASNESGFTNQFRYVGKYGVIYEDSSLYFMRARYYNPNKGRFLGEDEVWNTNLYSYSHNDPVNFNDFSGNSEQSPTVKYDDNSGNKGNCTWFVNVIKGGLDWKGHAGNYVNNAKNAAKEESKKQKQCISYDTHKDAVIGDLVIWTNGGYGHVGIVIGFDTDGEPLYAAANESNENTSDFTKGVVYINRVSSFTNSKYKLTGYISFNNSNWNNDLISTWEIKVKQKTDKNGKVTSGVKMPNSAAQILFNNLFPKTCE